MHMGNVDRIGQKILDLKFKFVEKITIFKGTVRKSGRAKLI